MPKPSVTPDATDTPKPSETPSAAPTAEPTEKPTPAPEYLYEINGCNFGEDGRINIDLKYNGDGADKAKLIIASYSENEILTGAKMFDITGGDLSGVEFYKRVGSDTIRIFIWDPDTLKPLALPK